MDNNKVFLNKIQDKIKKGEYNYLFTTPFMTKELFYSAIKGRIERKIEKGSASVLTDAELKSAIQDAKETSGSTFFILVNAGILEKNETGYQLSKKGEKAIKLISRI